MLAAYLNSNDFDEQTFLINDEIIYSTHNNENFYFRTPKTFSESPYYSI